MNFQPSSKKNAKKDSKTAKESTDDKILKREVCKEELDKEPEPIKKIENIEIINDSKDRDKQKHNIQSKTDYKNEKSTIDNSSNFSTLAKDKKQINPEFKTVDYDKKDNSRNLTAFGQEDHDKMYSLKHNKQKQINYIKNRRTGSTDWTNSNKLNKRDIKKISNFQRKAVIELDTEEGEIIESNRKNDIKKFSPSPSPNKYDIEPTALVKKSFNVGIQNNNYMDKVIHRNDWKQSHKVFNKSSIICFIYVEYAKRSKRNCNFSYW